MRKEALKQIGEDVILHVDSEDELHRQFDAALEAKGVGRGAKKDAFTVHEAQEILRQGNLVPRVVVIRFGVDTEESLQFIHGIRKEGLLPDDAAIIAIYDDMTSGIRDALHEGIINHGFTIPYSPLELGEKTIEFISA